jgi:Short C-terminal domain
VKTWITVSIIALAPMLIRAPKSLSPLRVSKKDRSRFASLFRRYKIHTVTGVAGDAGKRSDSITTGSISSSTGADGLVASVGGSIDTTVVVTDRFFVTDARGQVTAFEGAGFDARVGNGHVVSLAFVTHGLRKSGPYILIYNHTTREPFFCDQAIRKRLTFPFPTLYIALLCLMLLPIPVLLGFAVLEMWQKFRFERSGVRPLIEVLDTEATSLMRRKSNGDAVVQSAAAGERAAVGVGGTIADPASALRDMAALRDSGAISDAEYETAKSKILGSSW